MKLLGLLLSGLALFELHRAESSTACENNLDCTDVNFPECFGLYYMNGTGLVNGKCLSREDAAKEGYKVLKRCATFFEKAGGCECALNEPECKGTTPDALIPDGCMEMGQQMMLYCYSRKEICSGASVDGLPHRRFISKSVCCHKDCPRCGGNRCGRQTDSSGKKLGARNCCGTTILKREKVCGEHPAPCKVAVKGDNVFEDIMSEY